MQNQKHLLPCLTQALKDTISWELKAELPTYRKFTDDEEQLIDLIVNVVMNLPYIANQPGCCVLAHTLIYNTLRMLKIECELVIGRIIVDGKPVWPVTKKALKDMLLKGHSGEPFIAHVWLLLPDYTFVDATLFTDINQPASVVRINSQKQVMLLHQLNIPLLLLVRTM
ncbi:hypothetical protein [Psychromonas aquimarina]|uniref:hypothetical protein n=1 Tax=Psychromonas aquimarina TaxID=444919 RepID=UPI000490E567|nr:hypothetical protein [Psychromonas aquimarina]